MTYFLQSKQQAIDYITNIINAHNSKEITSNSDRYWIVSHCELSDRHDYWLISGNSRECVLYNRNCLAGVWGYAVDRISGEVHRCCLESPKDFVQRQYDIADASGKCYALMPNFKRSAPSIILIKQTFDLTLSQARYILDNVPIWFVDEKMVLAHIQSLCQKNGIELRLTLIDKTPDLNFSNEMRDCLWFDDLKRHIQVTLSAWHIK